MKKVLIYFPEKKLKPTGGQAGYLYNLKLGLNKVKRENRNIDICFYNDLPDRIEDNSKLKKIIPKRILDFRRAIKNATFLKKKFKVDNSLNDYDMIHFHWTEELYLNRDFLKEYKGKVILTSHSPCVMYKEKINKLNPFDYKLMKKKIDKLEEIDRYAFERADYIIFPCNEAEEPYFNTWPNYSSIRKAEKYRYLPTGIVECKAKVSREEYRKKYNIPNDAFVVSYVGRHNQIKGYEDLKIIGEKLLKKYRNIYFLIAGKEEPIVGLNDERWIEIGWTNDPHSLIAASDVFILPNKETYFDLILLEVISLGIPVILSETGGNKYFKRFKTDSIQFYDEIDIAVEKVEKFRMMSREYRKKLNSEIYQIFKDNFTVEKFTNNYLDIIDEISQK